MSSEPRFTEVGDRVLVARYPQWDVNVGLILGRAGAVVVDTRGSAVQGREALDAVRAVTKGLPVAHVVNTHVHFDHTFGNIAFEEATVHAHENVGLAIGQDAERIKALFRADPGDGPEMGYTAADVVQVLATEIRPPDRTFATEAVLDLGDRVVALAHAGRGHTNGDIRIAVPDADVVFLGDLIEEAADPSLGGDCWPLEWADTLTSHGGSLGSATVVVPGHGRPVDAHFVAGQRDDLAAVADVIRERRLAGLSLEEARREPDARLPYPLDWLQHAFARGWEQLPGPAR
jgi:glyoxylase-like metal-dependent hydrolase (beta-lactamase superfamily II)